MLCRHILCLPHTVQVWGNVYLMHRFTRASKQINENLHTFFFITRLGRLDGYKLFTFMKKRNFVFAAFAVAIAMMACEKPAPETQKPADEAKTYTVSFDLTGEIDVTQNPLSRVNLDDRDLFGIEVTYEGGRYAYGLFDDISKAKLDLSSNHRYEIKVLYVDDAKDKIRRDTLVFEDNNYYVGYAQPFLGYNRMPNGKIERAATAVTNEFYVGTDCYFIQEYERDFPRTKYYVDNYRHEHAPGLNVYYGQITNFTPSEQNETVQVYLKHIVYGLRIEVGDFFTNGTIKAELGDNDTYLLTPDNKVVEETFAYYLADSWYGKEDLSNAYVDRNITFTWTKEDGSTVSWKTQTVRFNRLRESVVNLELYESQANNGVNLTFEDLEMEKNYSNYIIGDEYTDYNWM